MHGSREVGTQFRGLMLCLNKSDCWPRLFSDLFVSFKFYPRRKDVCGTR